MALTRLFNGGPHPLTIDWSTPGVVMSGEYIDTDKPETFGPPWTVDAEAEAATRAVKVGGDAEHLDNPASPGHISTGGSTL